MDSSGAASFPPCSSALQVIGVVLHVDCIGGQTMRTPSLYGTPLPRTSSRITAGDDSPSDTAYSAQLNAALSASLDPEKQVGGRRNRRSRADEKRWDAVLRMMPYLRPTAWAEEIRWHHGGWWARRQKLIGALGTAPRFAKRLEALQCCGTLSYIERNDATEALRVTGRYCHDRLCARCAAAKSARMQRTIEAAAADAGTVRLVTLTLKHRPGVPLSAMIDRLYTCFRLLRATRVWKDRVTASLAVLELKLSQQGAWHVHFHCVAKGDFIPQRELSASWLAVTGDSSIVDVRVVPSGKAAGYVAKYLAKPIPASAWDSLPHLLDAIDSLKGRRLLVKTGEWHGHDFGDDATTEEVGKWRPIGLLAKFILRAQAGDAMSRMYLQLLRPADDPDRDTT